jgi:hypothetical protein
MKFKTLKHKDLDKTFGVIISYDEGQIRDADSEIVEGKIPELLQADTSFEKLKAANEYRTSFHQLEDYEIVDIEVLLPNELPSTKLEKMVLTDYLDWYKRKYGGVEMISDYWINEFVSGK